MQVNNFIVLTVALSVLYTFEWYELYGFDILEAMNSRSTVRAGMNFFVLLVIHVFLSFRAKIISFQ